MLAFETEDVLQAWALPMENIIVVGGFVLALATDVVGHGSSETIRAGGIPCAPFVPASELRACGDAAAGRLAGCDAYDGDRKALASVSN